MIVTVEEAKTKRCQEGFWPYAPMHSVNSAAPLTCIGSACMAWRWQNDALSDYPPDTKGYCGKAGKP